MNKLSQKRLVDRLMDAYVSWREACLQVRDAYGSWASETGSSHDPAEPLDGAAWGVGSR